MPETARLPSPELDLTRFAYVAKARAEALDLSYTNLELLTGLSRRQLSCVMNAKAVSAGATYVLAAALDIALDDMLPVETAERLHAVRRLRAEEAAAALAAPKQSPGFAKARKAPTNPSVTPPVQRETRGEK